jgi:hypothetical protein
VGIGFATVAQFFLLQIKGFLHHGSNKENEEAKWTRVIL